MLLGFILICLCWSTVQCAVGVSTVTSSTRFTGSATSAATPEGMLPALEIVARPDYPVAVGEEVHLNCSALPILMPVNWSWLHLQDNRWKLVGSEKELTLTKPEDSGVYRCQAVTRLSQMSQSQNYTIYIVSVQATVGENLGTAAFSLSVLNLVVMIAGLLWFGWQRCGGKHTTSSSSSSSSSPPVRSVPQPQATPKSFSPQADCDGDVYMNYTGTHQSYTDLNPANMNGDNLYSSLS